MVLHIRIEVIIESWKIRTKQYTLFSTIDIHDNWYDFTMIRLSTCSKYYKVVYIYHIYVCIYKALDSDNT